MTSDPHSAEFCRQYAAMTDGMGWAKPARPTQVELKGNDRSRFLNNLCTNQVASLEPCSGCEAFLTDVQGRTIGHLHIFCCPDSIVVHTVPRQSERLLAHLDRYLIREDVQLHDRTEQWDELLLAGRKVPHWLSHHGLRVPERCWGHSPIDIFGQPAWLRRVDLAGAESFLLTSHEEDIARICESLTSLEIEHCQEQVAETLRIESGTPYFGRDITEKNLPQEVNRNDRAISFQKGCYLGQETVARIDALGHVNRTLEGVRFFSSEVPEPGCALQHEEQPVGRVTSAAYSPRLGSPLALAYIRRGFHSPGTRLQSSFGQAEVISLPVCPVDRSR